jgi:hypothetical protein
MDTTAHPDNLVSLEDTLDLAYALYREARRGQLSSSDRSHAGIRAATQAAVASKLIHHLTGLTYADWEADPRADHTNRTGDEVYDLERKAGRARWATR